MRFGLMLVPFVMLLAGGIEIYLAASKYRSSTLFEMENGPSPTEVVELATSRSVLHGVVLHLDLSERMSVDRETAAGTLKEVTTARVLPDTRLVEIEVTLIDKMAARDVAEQIPLRLTEHLADAAAQKDARTAGGISDLIRKASDLAEEKATALANLEKVHGPKPEDSALVLKHQRTSRESLLADAEVERLRNLRSACLTENLNQMPKLTVHSAPVISEVPVDLKSEDLGELALCCLISGLLTALLLPYLMELAFPAGGARTSEPTPDL